MPLSRGIPSIDDVISQLNDGLNSVTRMGRGAIGDFFSQAVISFMVSTAGATASERDSQTWIGWRAELDGVQRSLGQSGFSRQDELGKAVTD